MLYVNAKERSDIKVFRALIYNKIKSEGLRYSDQRERVLKILYEQNYPVSIEFLVKKLGEVSASANYATVARHIKFFESLEMLLVVNKTPKGYLLKESVSDADVDVLHRE